MSSGLVGRRMRGGSCSRASCRMGRYVFEVVGGGWWVMCDGVQMDGEGADYGLVRCLFVGWMEKCEV